MWRDNSVVGLLMSSPRASCLPPARIVKRKPGDPQKSALELQPFQDADKSTEVECDGCSHRPYSRLSSAFLERA